VDEEEKMNVAIIPGAKVGHWRVAGVNGRAAFCQCRCGVIRNVAVSALMDGTPSSCGCAPPSPEQSDALRAEAEQRQRRRDLKDWRPGQRTGAAHTSAVNTGRQP
jgi:hypothetical protein